MKDRCGDRLMRRAMLFCFEMLTQPMGNLFQEGGTFYFGNSTGNALTDFEVGFVSETIQGGGLFLNFTGINWSAFVQDEWKATPRLTISTGLRWDPWIFSKDSMGRVTCYDPGVPQLVRYPNATPGLIYGGKNHDPGCPETGIFGRRRVRRPHLLRNGTASNHPVWVEGQFLRTAL